MPEVSEQLGLELERPWPQRPPAPRGEQRVLAIPGTIEERYTAWRATDAGRAVWHFVEGRALAARARGESRIEVNKLVAEARDALHVHCNNTFRAPLARELVDRHPVLDKLIERRRRTAA